MNYLWSVFELLINLAYGTLWCFFIIKYFNFKKNIKATRLISTLFSIILFVIISVFNYVVIYEGFLSSIYVLVIFIFAGIFLNGNFWEKLVISIFEQLLLSGTALTTVLSIGLLLEEEYAGIIDMEFSLFRLISIIVGFIIYLLILKLILYLKKEFNEMTKFQWFIIISIPLISLLLIVSIVELILMITTQKSYYIFLIISILSVIILNMLIYIFMGILNRNNKMLLKYQLENQQRLYEEKNIENIKNMYERIRILKHDMKHHNEVIISKINNLPGINNLQHKYIKDIVSYVSDISEIIDSVKSTIYTGNKSVDSLLNYKIITAVEKNINIETVIDKNISGISDIDLCSILGNLLDNAIEACEKVNVGNRTIVLCIVAKNSCLLIYIKNSISEPVITANPNLTTTKENKEIHGLGLKSIKAITEKYSGSFKTSEEENFFIVEVLLIGK